MAGLSYMQRQSSGIYEFRKRLPQEFAGKSASQNLPTTFSELVNSATKRFKREITGSLQTADFASAKRKDVRKAISSLSAVISATLRGSVQWWEGKPLVRMATLYEQMCAVETGNYLLRMVH